MSLTRYWVLPDHAHEQTAQCDPLSCLEVVKLADVRALVEDAIRLAEGILDCYEKNPSRLYYITLDQDHELAQKVLQAWKPVLATLKETP